MSSRLAFFWILVLTAPFAAAQPELPSAVVISDDTNLMLHRDGTVRERVHRVVQVLGPAGQEAYGTLVLGHDAFRRIISLEGEIRDGDGERIRTLERDDIEDHPATSGYSLYDDNRIRVARLFHSTYPYTVEWSYEVEHEGLLNWPTWRPQRGEEPVLHAALVVQVPDHVGLRYLPERLDIEPEVRERDGQRILHWSGSFPARAYEPLGPSWYDQLPRLHLVTDTFEMDGRPGRLDSWASLGQWYDELADGRDALPREAVEDVLRLTDGVEDPRERARLVYEYLQENTRYVSVQLGIGGWQPFPASYVHERRYGDCKALTNYLGALLAAAEVRSFPALIGSGRPDLAPDFPHNAFNHVILYVPLPDGDLWLEATSQTAPFGYLGPGTEDRWVLVTEPGSGRLVRTPASAATDNAQVRHAEVELSAGGHLRARVETRTSGHQLHSLRDAVAARAPQEQAEWWVRRLGLPVEAVDVAFDGEAGTVEASFAVPRYGVQAGSRLLFRPNVVERWSAVPPPVEERTQPVDLSYRFADTDTVRITLPARYDVEALPEPIHLETPFARYDATAELDGDGHLVYARYVEMGVTELPPEEYAAYREFVAAVVRADDAQVILRRR